jgi:hypothetical protein
LTRLLFLLFATLQMAVPPVVAWADATTDRSTPARGVVGHIETQTDEGCPGIHAADCALCHAAVASFTRPEAGTPVATLRRRVPPVHDVARAHAPADGGAWDARPRAPPSLS